MEKLILEKGKHYLVKHSDGKNFVRRFFKHYKKRFDSISCYVFSTKIDKKLEVNYDPENNIFRMIGKKIPAQEISIPHYNLIEVKEIV